MFELVSIILIAVAGGVVLTVLYFGTRETRDHHEEAEQSHN